MRIFRVTLAGIVAAALLYAGLTDVDWPSVLAGLRSASPGLTVAALLSVFLTLLLVTIRWAALLDARITGAAGVRLWNTVTVGQAANIVAPFRFGEGLRLVLTCRWLHLPAGRVAMAIVGERVCDMGAFAVVALALAFAGALPAGVSGAAPVGFLAAVGALATLIGFYYFLPYLISCINPSSWLRRQSQGLVDEWRARSPARIAAIVLFTGLILSASALTNLLIFDAFSLRVPWFAAIVLLIVSQVGTAVVSVPGNVGVFHYLTVLALGAWNVPRDEALATAVVLHLVSLGPRVVLGGIAIVWAGGAAPAPAPLIRGGS